MPSQSLELETLVQVLNESSSETYVFDASTMKFVFVNRTARENLGFSQDELFAMSPWELKPDIPQNAFIEMVEPLLTGDPSRLNFETLHQRKDGSRYPVSVRLQLLHANGRKLFHAAIDDITERKQVEEELASTTWRLDSILNNTMMAIFMMDDHQECVFMNDAAEALTGYTFEETRGRPLHDVIHHTHPDGRPFPISECSIDRAFPKNSQTQGEEVFVHKDGTFYPVGFTASPMHDPLGNPVGTVIEVRDIADEIRARETMESFNTRLKHEVAQTIAERESVEKQLHQAQKMEAVGQLTGGVAHDFNNLLQVIGGNLQLLTKNLTDDAAQRRIKNAQSAVESGGKLASQLLSFGRRQPLEPKAVNLGAAVREMDDILRRSLGDGVEVETIVAAGLWNVFIDRVQFENALLNLAINARDAMEGFGKLTVEIGNAYLDDTYAAAQADVTPGQYVVLAVTDTGCGMPKEMVEKVFEPFFSTKPEGHGTGLGLSMVYGFIKQSGGHIKIYSEVGEGTTVRVYLSRSRREVAPEAKPNATPAKGGRETVLLVEDDAAVRQTALEMLTDLGYYVLQADNADSAIAVLDSGVSVDVLFTDVVMPGTLRAPELAKAAQQRHPELAVLFTSGYTQNAIVHAGRLDDGVDLLSKPFTRDALARKLRKVIESRPSPAEKAENLQKDEESQQANESMRLLLVEDEALIRLATADMLADLGHVVLEAGNVSEAVALLEREPVDIMICDVSLPDGSGLDLARDVSAQGSVKGIILASGHPVSKDELRSTAQCRMIAIGKPYDEDKLRAAILSVTD